MESINCSIGVMAYNEEANIGRLLEALLRQRLSACSIGEIFVVSSGSTDRTDEIIAEYAGRDRRIELLAQKKREGKASAINLFLSRASGDVLVVESGDTIPADDGIENLVKPFLDPRVGMTGGRPVPVNSDDNFMGYVVNLLWKLHHQISLAHPKLGEMVAFRNVVREIPRDTAVDEASIEAIVTAAGYELKYVPDALVYNKGADCVADFLKQRRRIAAGHLYLQRTQDYAVATSSVRQIIGPLIKEMNWGPRDVVWTAGAVFLEAVGRMLGYYDYIIRKKNPFIWDIAESTKEPGGSSK